MVPAPEIAIGPHLVGDGNPCYVIAEAGANHNRNLDTAHRLIDVAADAGADAVKFQTYTGSDLYSTKTPRFDYLAELGNQPIHELLDNLALPREWQPMLMDHAKERGIEFLSSPFDLGAVEELATLGVAAFKVASFEIVDHSLIAAIAHHRSPIIFSTGMATLGEIDEALHVARAQGADQFCLLQCASLYPSPPSIMNLRVIPSLKAAFRVPVGLSDHTTGIHIACAAVAMGANLIEKHFTLDRRSEGPDHPFAIEPEELHELVRNIRDVEAAMGDGLKQGPSPEESEEMYLKARRSVVAACDIPLGTRITREMLTIKRPGFGVAPRLIDALVGRTASVDIERDDVIVWEMV